MVISLTVTESELQKLAGFPISVSVETNIVASIFYTLDGTDPTTDSDIYIDEIILPTNQSYVVLKIFATNGLEDSAIFSKTYGQNFVGLDLGSSKVVNYPEIPQYDLFPFGDNLPGVGAQGGQPAGLILDTGGVPNVPDGYDADGNPHGGINEGVVIPNPLYSETDRYGRTGRGIGTLPSQTIIRLPTPDPDSSNTNSKFFNPKAKVIFQNYDDTENQDILQLNRPRFSLTDPQKNAPLFSYGEPDSLPMGGSALRQLPNPKDGTLNYYYLDSHNLKWLISKEKFLGDDINYSAIPNSRNQGAGIVLNWIPFFRKRII